MLFPDVTCTVTESLKKNKDFGLFDVLDPDCMIVITLLRSTRRIQTNGIYEKRVLDHDKIYRFIQLHFDEILSGRRFSNFEYENYYFHMTSCKQARPFFAFTLVIREGCPFPEDHLAWLDTYERLNFYRALVENEAAQQKNLRDSLFESVGFSILILDKNRKILQQNQKAAALFENEIGQVLTLSLSEQNQILQKLVTDTLKTQILQLKSGFVFGSGDSARVLTLNCSPLSDSKNKMAGVVITAVDRTDRKLLQMENEQLRQYGFIGEFSMGLAHDIKNPLMIINGCAKQLPKEYDSLKNIILYQANRINEVINELMSVGNFRQDTPKVSLNLNDVLVNSIALMGKHRFNKDIDFRMDFSENLPLFQAKEIHIRQIFSNLILNAMESISDTGFISLKSRFTDTSIVIEIEDNGCGMAPELLEQIFEPYYTTKKNGTGMGLFLVKKILESYGGHIDVRSTQGKGTCFTVFFPLDTTSAT